MVSGDASNVQWKQEDQEMGWNKEKALTGMARLMGSSVKREFPSNVPREAGGAISSAVSQSTQDLDLQRRVTPKLPTANR